MKKPDGKLLAFPGQVLDFDALPDGAELVPGQQVRHDGKLWTIHDLPHCYDDVPVLVRTDAGERWCSDCGDIPMDECTSTGGFDGGLL